MFRSAVRVTRSIASTARRPQRNIMTSTKTGGMSIKFGPFEVTKQVFLATPHSYALVNLKPLIPGHILVCPLKPRLRLTDLSPAETADLFNTVQLTQRMLAQRYFPVPGDLLSGSFTVAVQDGPDSGQTVPHLHVHVIPRKKGDVGDSPDAIYTKMASEDGNVGGAMWDMERRPAAAGGLPKVEDENRKPRTQEEMETEAEQYRTTLRELGVE